MTSIKELVKDFHIENKFFAFVGQDATIGAPHPVTGRCDIAGYFESFNTKEARNYFVNNFHSNNPSAFAVRCTAYTGRKFRKGTSMYDYIEELAYADFE